MPHRGIGVAWDCPVTHTHMPHPLGKFSYQCSRQGCSEVQYPPNQSMGRYTDMADCQQACDLGHFSYKCVSPLQGCAEVQQPPNKAAGRYTTRDQCRQVCHPARQPVHVHVQGSCRGPSGCAEAKTYSRCMANNAAGCKWIRQKDAYSDTNALSFFNMPRDQKKIVEYGMGGDGGGNGADITGGSKWESWVVFTSYFLNEHR